MKQHPSPSQQKAIPPAVPEQQAMSLLRSIERRTAYFMTQIRKVLELLQSSELQLPLGGADFQQRHQNAMSEMSIHDLERYAPQWGTLVPNNPCIQSALSHQLSKKYGLLDQRDVNLCQALNLESDAVKVAYESQYGQSIDALFQAAEENSQQDGQTITQDREQEVSSQKIGGNVIKTSEALRETSEVSPPIIEQVQQEERYDLESELEWVNLATHDLLFEQGDPGDSLYVIVDGRLRVMIESDGVHKVLREVGPGEIIGEMALITGTPRSTTLEAERDTTLLKLSKESFERLTIHYPQIMLQIARIQSKRIRLLSERPVSSSKLASLTVIPASPDVPLTEFCQRLIRALSPYGSSLHLTSEQLEQEIQRGALSEEEYDRMIVAWLSEQEMKVDFVIYQSDNQPSSWTSRCLRQADHILIVGQAKGSPELGAIEQAMGDTSHIRRSLALLHPDGNQPPLGTSKWLAVRDVERHHHLRWNMESDFERLARLLTGNGIGLVLSGGGARGLAHMGVIGALYEEGIPIDMIGGTSQGAWIAAVCAMGMDYEAMMSISEEMVKQVGRPSLTLPMVSLVKGNSISRGLDVLFGHDPQIEDLWINFYCVSANLSTNKMMVHQSGSLAKYVRASSAIPGVLPPVVDGDHLLVDGATVNNLPTDVMRELIQNGIVFASSMARRKKSSQKKKRPKEQYGRGLSGWRVLWRYLNPFTKPVNLPSIADVIMRSMSVSHPNTIEEREKATDFHFKLDVRPYSAANYAAYEALANIGYQTAQEDIAGWKANEQWGEKGLERFSQEG